MKKKQVDVAIFVEHVARELDIAVLLESGIRKLNPDLRVWIGSLYYEFRDIGEWLSPRVVVMPFCYGIDAYYKVLLAAFPDAGYVNLAFEQLFAPISVAGRMPKDDFSRRRVLHVAWNEEYAGFLRRYGAAEDRIVVNGCLPHALYSESYRGLYPGRRELARRFGLDPAKRWVFFPENYAVAFLSDASLAAFVAKGSYTTEEGQAYRAFARESLSESLRWLATLDPREYEVIIRPRPAIPLRRYREAIRDTLCRRPAHIRLMKQLSVREWILASDVTVSSYSTTLVEAAVAGKPAIMLKPRPFFPFMHAEWHDHANIADSREAFLALVSGDPIPGDGRLRAWAEAHLGSGGHDPIEGAARLIAQMAGSVGEGGKASLAAFLRSRVSGFLPILQRRHKGHENDRISAWRIMRSRSDIAKFMAR